MNKKIIEQLKKVKSCDVEFSEDDKVVLIKKTVKIVGRALTIGSTYILKLHSNVTNPTSGSTLASNWNNGVIPQYDTYIVEILDNVAKMVKVNGVAMENTSSAFTGWLPHDSFDVIQKI